ncbi:MAG: peptidase BlaR1 [Gemmatimonadetes bacterium]|nr:peptidase BlaR1 [Gemmatimonadota bacterium]
MSSLMTSPVVAMLAKVTLLLVLGLLVASRIRSTAPELRHLLLFSTLASALALPFALVLLPRWEAPLLPSRAQSVAAATPALAADMMSPALAADVPSPAIVGSSRQWARAGSLSVRARTHPATTLLLIWIAGSIVAMLMLAMGYLRLHRITQRAWPLEIAEWSTLLQDERVRAHVAEDVALLVSPVASTPLTWGARPAVILLPEDALDWPAEHRRVVLRHELAHIARKDAAAQLVASVACGVYWFHPLVWIAARRLRAECERACDDRVLSSGTPAADYAAHLLEVARSTRSLGGPGFLSVAMARPSQLEGRLVAILDNRRRIALTRRSRLLAVSFSALIVLAVSGFRAVPRATTPATTTRAAIATAVSASAGAFVAPTLSSMSAAAVARRADTTFEKSVDVRSGETLILDLNPTGGAVTISGWDEPRVLVRGTLAGRGWRGTQISLEAEDGGARLQTRFVGRSGDESFSHRFEINVPRQFNVRVKSAGGSITIANVEGTFRGSTGGGSIDIQRASGDVRLGTGGGDVRVSDSDLRGSVSTGGGAVRISNVTGGLVGSSGSGDVIINGREGPDGRSIGRGSSAASGRAIASSSSSVTTYTANDGASLSGFARSGVQQRRSGGDIVLSEAPNGARVSTGGGTIRIARSGGDVYANTGGGQIDIGPSSGSVVASTGAGDISVAFDGAGAHSGELTTGHGQIELVLPSDISATVILETAYTNNFNGKTKIESDWPVSVTESPDWDASQGTPRRYVRSRLVLGSGEGVITVRAVNGNVIVKRAP